ARLPRAQELPLAAERQRRPARQARAQGRGVHRVRARGFDDEERARAGAAARARRRDAAVARRAARRRDNGGKTWPRSPPPASPPLTPIRWDVDPLPFSLGPLTVRWYGLLFVGAFFVGQGMLARL